MTVDERLEFLLKSTESLHSTVHENTGQIAEVTGQIAELTRKLDGMANTVSDLALIARDHERRLRDNGA